MSHTRIERSQVVKTDLDSLWNFMSSPKNLSKITPKYMDFKITSNNQDEKIYPGMIISYKVTPLLKIPITWITEITQVKEKTFFVDEQKIGPYKIWIHKHIFKELDEGILITDIITYIPRFGFVGKIANRIFIKNRVNYIFDYRKEIIEKIFN